MTASTDEHSGPAGIDPIRHAGRVGLDRWREVLGDVRSRAVAVPLIVVGGVALVAVVGMVALAILILRSASPRAGPVEDLIPTVSQVAVQAAPPTVTEPYLHVHVAGAVARPGLYRLPAGARVADAVTAAGGLADSADPDRVNLAVVLSDGEQVAVPRVGEAGGGLPSGIPAGPGRGVAGDGGQVDINTAGPEELQQLRGIGPARAEAIITHREEFGPFSSVDDLADVPGIGPATIDGLRDAARV
jgi:competence protein ComEA